MPRAFVYSAEGSFVKGQLTSDELKVLANCYFGILSPGIFLNLTIGEHPNGVPITKPLVSFHELTGILRCFKTVMGNIDEGKLIGALKTMRKYFASITTSIIATMITPYKKSLSFLPKKSNK